MSKPLKVHRFHEGDAFEVEGRSVPAIAEGHEVDVNTYLFVINYGGHPCDVTIPTFELTREGVPNGKTVLQTVTVPKRKSPTEPTKYVLGMCGAGTIKYGKWLENVTVCAFRFDPKDLEEPLTTA